MQAQRQAETQPSKVNIMHKLVLASTPLLFLAVALPAFSQGATQSPPSPNSSNNLPQSPNSVPPGARTMPRNTTGIERMGTISRTQFNRLHRGRAASVSRNQ